MPTYDYQCIRCGKITEQFFLSMAEAPMEIWCECSAMSDDTGFIPIAKRIISPGAGFTFNQPGGTISGAKKEAEVRAAMRDYTSGKNKKESD